MTKNIQQRCFTQNKLGLVTKSLQIICARNPTVFVPATATHQGRKLYHGVKINRCTFARLHWRQQAEVSTGKIYRTNWMSQVLVQLDSSKTATFVISKTQQNRLCHLPLGTCKTCPVCNLLESYNHTVLSFEDTFCTPPSDSCNGFFSCSGQESVHHNSAAFINNIQEVKTHNAWFSFPAVCFRIVF